MQVDYRNSFKLHGVTVYPAKDGERAGYVQQGREWDLFEWEDLEAVTRFTRDVDTGDVDPAEFMDSELSRHILLGRHLKQL